MERTAAIDRSVLEKVKARELERFAGRTQKSTLLRERAAKHLPNGVPMTWMAGLYRFLPIYITHGAGASFYDADGNAYLDFNVCDLAMTMGYGPKAVAEAVSKAIKNGAHFLLPTNEAMLVAEELSERVGLPFWQFTLSASGANAEVLRIARAATGRRKLLVFQGHCNGHFDESLVTRTDKGVSEADLMGLSPEAARDTIVLPFNDLEALEACLSGRDVALVLTEPAMTNCTLVKPMDGYLAGLERLARKYGSLVCYDEAHTFQFAFGGLVRAWNLKGDFVVFGKGFGTGVSFGLYGMSDEVAKVFVKHSDVDIGPKGIATGGTTYATNLAVAAAQAALFEVLTPTAYERIDALGKRMADGLDRVFAELRLPWTALHLGPRAGYCLKPTAPRTGLEAWESIDSDFIDTRRLYLANRGVWDAVASAGPQASLVHETADIDCYVSVAAQFLGEILGQDTRQVPF